MATCQDNPDLPITAASRLCEVCRNPTYSSTGICDNCYRLAGADDWDDETETTP